MIRNVNFNYQPDDVLDTIRRFCRRDAVVALDARRLAEGLFGDHLLTNLFALGAAYQAGQLPLTAESLEAAIRLNGVQVESNLQAFRYGRLHVHDRARVEALIAPVRPDFSQTRDRALAPLSAANRRAYDALLARLDRLDEESTRLVAIRIAELIDYQNARYAERYVEFVRRVAETEQGVCASTGAITQAAARYHAKLLAYKDEYEVARLHLKPHLREKTQSLFREPTRIAYQLHPPVLRALGLKRKISLGPWFDPVLRLLRAGKRLRASPFDPFGYAAVRREERALPGWYEALMTSALARLTPANRDVIAEIACVPDAIRGYENIKLRNIAAARERATSLLARLQTPASQSPSARGTHAPGAKR
jgi:indolepyruvate ferredoxin oxidoreductase